MALQSIMNTGSAEEISAEPLVIKKSGSYEYVDTPNEGIKKIVSKQGGYLVFLDYGRKLKMNKKTGKQEYKQDKTARRVETEAEAKKLRREAEMMREGIDPNTHKRKKILFKDMIKEFKESPRFADLSDSYKDHIDNHIGHFMDFFADMEPAKITQIDIEDYFAYQLKCGNKNKRKEGEPVIGVSVNTLPKHRSSMKKIWEYMIDSKKYGVTDNVPNKAAIPMVEVCIDGKVHKVSKIKFVSIHMTLEQLNYTLNDMIQNEFDRSLLLAVGLSTLGSLRHSEVEGLTFKNFYHNELMNVSEDAMRYGGFDKEYYEQHEDLMFIDSARMRIRGKEIIKLPKHDKVRISAIPNALREIADYALEQRLDAYKILNKELDNTEQMYFPLHYIFGNFKFNSAKLGNRWNEYQRRRTARMEKAGLEPIPYIRFHDLRHTHSNILKVEVPSWEISCNMGHSLPEAEANTTKIVYWNDRQPYRKHIIDYFNENIKLDWDKAMRKNFEGLVGVSNCRRFVMKEYKEVNKNLFIVPKDFKDSNVEDMIPDANVQQTEVGSNEEKMRRAVRNIVESINNARQEGLHEVVWYAPKELDRELRDMFGAKGYTFKTVPYRAGFFGDGDYICW